MSESPVLPVLFTQLQARYPTSGLLTELVQIDADRSVVRALVQLGSITLATSMATAATVEQAEDQARLRVLALLGIHPTPHFGVPDVSFSSHSTPPPPLITTFQDKTLDGIALHDGTAPAVTLPASEAIAPLPVSLAAPLVAPDTTTPTVTEGELEVVDDAPDWDDVSYNQATYHEEPFDEYETVIEDGRVDRATADRTTPALEKELTTQSKPRKAGAAKTPPVSETDTPDRGSDSSSSRDLSSLISQIGVEIDRIGWSKRQGSTYLQKTYGKKTRSELTDDELEDFLTYLNTQPSATATP